LCTGPGSILFSRRNLLTNCATTIIGSIPLPCVRIRSRTPRPFRRTIEPRSRAIATPAR
jgi:hypothetical protein